MSKVLTDLYSLFDFDLVADTYFDGEVSEELTNCYPFIENLLLCDKIMVDRNGVELFQLEGLCKNMDDVFSYIEDERLYSKDRAEYSQGYSVEPQSPHERAYTYMVTAKDKGVYFAPHPNREKILATEISNHVRRTAKAVIDYVDGKVMQTEEGGIVNIDIQVPPLVEHVLHFSRTKKITITESVNELRNSKNARSFRSYFDTLDEELAGLSPRKKLASLQPLFEDIKRLSDAWAIDLHNEVKYRKRRINLTKLPLVGIVFAALGTPSLEVNDPVLSEPKDYRLFLNEIYTLR